MAEEASCGRVLYANIWDKTERHPVNNVNKSIMQRTPDQTIKGIKVAQKEASESWLVVVSEQEMATIPQTI